MNIRLLWMLTGLAAAFVFLAYQKVDTNELSALGGIISAAGSVLAVLWFSAGLHYQTVQLKEQRIQLDEQRKQFNDQFHHIRQSTVRDAINMGREILSRAEDRVRDLNPEVSRNFEISVRYLNMEQLGPLLKSDSPHEVMACFERWMKVEGPALIMVGGMKSALSIYLEAIQAENINYKLPAEEFVFIYWCWVSDRPYFSEFSGLAKMLPEMMFILAPGRAAALIAHNAAMFKIGH